MNEQRGKRVRLRRLELGLSQADLAERVGISQQSIGKIETGRTGLSRYALRIAKALELPIDVLEFGQTQTDKLEPPNTAYAPGEAVPVRVISVFATELIDGKQIFPSGPPIGFTAAPEPLRQSLGGSAFYLSEAVMSPAYEPGDVIVISPDLPPVIGADQAFIARRDAAEVLATPREVEVRRLISQTADAWIGQQWDPKATREYPKTQWRSSRVVAVFRRV